MVIEGFLVFFCLKRRKGFLISAIMELFIYIPYEKRESNGNIFSIGYSDLKESFNYMYKGQPLILKFSFLIAGINLILSSLMMIGLPIIVTQLLGFNEEMGNRLYGYAEGCIAIGSLCGGLGAGMFAGKLKVRNGYMILLYDALTLIPIGLALILPMSQMIAYGIIMASCFVMMFLATLFSVQIMSYLQMVVPEYMLGKIISCASCIGMCATPLGQAIYGALFEILKTKIGIVFLGAASVTVIISLIMKKEYVKLEKILKKL